MSYNYGATMSTYTILAIDDSKKILDIAVSALALTTASMAASGDALAKGSGGGGGGGGGGGKGNGHGWSHFGGGGVVIDSGCWRWLPLTEVTEEIELIG